MYELLRAGEKSQPVPNLADANYSHIGRTKPESASPDIRCSMQIHNTRVRQCTTDAIMQLIIIYNLIL